MADEHSEPQVMDAASEARILAAAAQTGKHSSTIRSMLVGLALACTVPALLLAAWVSYGNIAGSKLLGWLVIGSAVLLALSLGLAWRTAGRIARPLHALVDPTVALGFAEKVVIPPLHLKEADDIGQALVKASVMLHQAQYQAQHDALTGLANRMLFNEFVNQQVALCRRNEDTFAVLYIDLDGFKSVNDRHGDAVGDEILRAVAGRLKAGIRDSDIAARFGGDEFAAVLIYAGLEGGATVARKLVESLSLPYPVGSETVEISVSIGVAGYPDSGTSAEKLLHGADEAMRKAKAAGKRRYAVALE